MLETFYRLERVCNISDLNYETDNRGYMIFKNVAIARDGVYNYYGCEIGRNAEPNKLFKVYRDSSTYNGEVVEKSLENIPITDEHPARDVNNQNYSVLEKGHTEGKPFFSNGKLIVPKIVIKDADLQEKIKNGKREVSIGFLGNYKWGDRPSTCNQAVDGTEHIHSINHLAVVTRGKAGPQFRFNRELIPDHNLDVQGRPEMDEKELQSALAKVMSPIQNKLNEVSDSMALTNARMDHIEEAIISNDSDKEEKKEKEHKENGVINPSMNSEGTMTHGHVDTMKTGEEGGESGEHEILKMAHPETKAILNSNAKVLSLLNDANSRIELFNKEMKEHEEHKEEEEKGENCHNALKALNEAQEKLAEAKNVMAEIPAEHNSVSNDFAQACEKVINASETLEDIATQNVARDAARVGRKVYRLERTFNVLSPKAPKSAAEGHSEDEHKHREYLTRGGNSKEAPRGEDPLLAMNRPVNNRNSEIMINYDLSSSGNPFTVPNGFMQNERARINNGQTSLQPAEVGSALFAKVANQGLGIHLNSYDARDEKENQSLLK